MDFQKTTFKVLTLSLFYISYDVREKNLYV